MATTLYITPDRFIAGAGKLDSLNGYMARTTLGDSTSYFPNGPTIAMGSGWGWAYNAGSGVSWSNNGTFTASVELMRTLF